MNNRWILYIAFITIVIVACLFTFFPHERIPTNGDVTLNLIRRCEWMQSRFSKITSEDLTNYIKVNEADDLSLGQIFYIMTEYPQYLPERIVGNTNLPALKNIPSLIDAWQRPINIFWRHDYILTNCNSALQSGNLPLIIWSSGPNGSNEFGNGDDVFVGKGIYK